MTPGMTRSHRRARDAARPLNPVPLYPALLVAEGISGHQTDAMVERYSTLRAEE